MTTSESWIFFCQLQNISVHNRDSFNSFKDGSFHYHHIKGTIPNSYRGRPTSTRYKICSDGLREKPASYWYRDSSPAAIGVGGLPYRSYRTRSAVCREISDRHRNNDSTCLLTCGTISPLSHVNQCHLGGKYEKRNEQK
jgi:hypothetical protein